MLSSPLYRYVHIEIDKWYIHSENFQQHLSKRQCDMATYRCCYVSPSLELGKQPEASRMHHLHHSLWQTRRISQLHSQHLAGTWYSISRCDLILGAFRCKLWTESTKGSKRIDVLSSWFLNQLSCRKNPRDLGPAAAKRRRTKRLGLNLR